MTVATLKGHIPGSLAAVPKVHIQYSSPGECDNQ